MAKTKNWKRPDGRRKTFYTYLAERVRVPNDGRRRFAGTPGQRLRTVTRPLSGTDSSNERGRTPNCPTRCDIEKTTGGRRYRPTCYHGTLNDNATDSYAAVPRPVQ